MALPDKPTVLMVDDAPTNLKVLTAILRAEYRLLMATTGLEGWDLAVQRLPDLILLDVVLPDVDGFEICARLKADERTREIPVLFISALEDTRDKVRAFAVGGVDYVTKPIHAEEVLARVRTHLRLRRLQQQLQAELVERGRLIAELDAYAHTVAHDLKTPLSPMIGYAELLLEYDRDLSPDAIREELQIILSCGRRLAAIVDSLLMLASTRRQQVKVGPLDMAGIVAEAMERLAADIKAQHAEIALPAAWPVAWGYAPWVEEIWANYVGNGLKYGGRPDAEPPVPPRLELGTDDDGGPSVRFWVRDNGVGIPVERQGELFVPFSRVGTGSAAGTGLGLSIVQRIAERLGGEVSVISAPGQGSTFSFTLPRTGQRA
jgi:two-component system sensor histidine kinase/response regulator